MEDTVRDFLRAALPLVQEEAATTVWFALQFGPSSFGIFDAFPDDDGRRAHLAGRVAAALAARAGELLAAPPVIEQMDTVAAKLPGA